MLMAVMALPFASQAQEQSFDFEDNLIPAGWTNSATYPWTVTNAKNHTPNGSYCIKSGNAGVNSSESSIEATITLDAAAYISFWCWASCESATSYWDYGEFYIDNVQMDRFLDVTAWQTRTYALTAGTHTFKWNYKKDSSSANNDDCFYVDDITIEVPSCYRVTNLVIDSVTTESITLSWEDPSNDNPTYNVYMVTPTDTTLIESATDTFYTVENLTANTAYTFAVRTDCGGGDLTEYDFVSGRTACGAITIDNENNYSDNFNSYNTDIATSTSAPSNYPNNTLPSCWDFLNMSNSTSGYPQVFLSSSTSYASSGNCLFFKSSNSTPLYAILPVLSTEDITRLRFNYRNEGTGAYNGTLSVGYLTDATDATTFTAVETYPQITTITSAEALFTSEMVTNGARIAFCYTGGSSNNYYLSIDDVVIEQGPSCMKVLNLAVDTTTTNSVTLTWESDGNSFIVYDMADSSVVATVTDTFAVIPQLNANTAYIFGVANDCGNEVSDTVCISTRTACDLINSLPYTCGFETSEQLSGSNPMPTCWTKNNGGVGNYPYCYSTTSHTGSYALYFYSSNYSSSADYEIAALPPVDIETLPLSGLQLSFWARYSSNAVPVIIGTMSNPTDETSFTALDTINVNSTAYQRYDVDLTQAPETDSYVAIRVNKGSSYMYLYIDDVELHEQPVCSYVRDLEADSIGSDVVILTWTDNDNSDASYTVYNMADTTVIGTTTDSTFTVEELMANTGYEFGVMANCTEGNAEIITVSVRTACDVFTIDDDNSFFENFNSGLTSGIPNCWDNSEGTTTYDSYKWIYTYSASEAFDSTYMRFNSYSNSTGLTNFLATPVFELNVPTRLRFMYKNPAGGDFSVLVGAPGSTQRTTLASGLTGATSWTEKTIMLPEDLVGDTVVIYFKGTSNYGSTGAYLYLDNVKVDAQPSCLPVSGVTVSNITNTSAVISWRGNEANENATYTIYNGQEEVASELTDTVYTYTDLEENTTYNLTIVTDCGDDPAEAVPVSFHTLCDPVELPIVESFEDTSATVNCWTFDANSAANANNMGIVTFNNHKMMKFLASSYDASVNSQYLQYGYSPLFDVSEDATALRVKVRYSTYYSTYSTYVQLYFGYKLADGTEIWGEDGHTSTGTTTFAYAIDTIPATAVQVMVKYRSTSYSTSYAAYIDSIMVEEIEDEICFPVANLNIDSATTESISISWVSDAESFTVLNMNDTTVAGTTSETNYTIEELEANMVYTFGVVVNCSSSNSDTIYVTGRTECAAYATPYTWTFDTLMTANATPICFNHIGNGVANVQTSQPHSGTSSVKFSGASGNNILVMPQTVAEANTLQLKFWTKPEGNYTSCGNFTVGYLTNAADPTTYVVLDSMNYADFGSTPAYTLKTVMYANVPEGARMAMRHNATSSSYYWFVDDITIEELPACVPVSQLAATMAEDGAYTLTWVSNAESFTILNMADSSVAGTASENSFTIDNLEAMTTYTYGVTVNCGNENSDTVVVSFTTPCDAIATPYFEDFEAGNASITCWSMVNTHTSTGFQTSGGINGSGCFRFYYSTNPPQYLISPMLSIPEGDSVMLEFRYKAYSTSYTETFHVGYSYTGNNVSDFTWGPEISTNITSYQLYNTMLNDSVKFIAFKYTANDQFYLFIDSLYIGEPPTCFPVTDLTVDTIDETSATISWNGTSASYSIYKNGVYVTNVTDTTYSFTDLVASTSYTFGVRGVCDVDDSTTIVNVTAATPCGIITDFPYTQDFNSEPACWTAIDADGDGYNWYIYSGAMQSASYDDGVLTPDNWLISPQFALPSTGNYEVTWTAMAQDQSWPAEHYGVYVSTTGNNTTDFTMLQEWTLSTGAYNPVIDLSDYAGQNIYIALRHFNCTDMFRMSIDDFIVREQPGANQVVINVQQNNPAYGSVSGAGVFNIGDSVTVSATAASGYVFNRWVDADNVTISTENPYTFAAATNLTLMAIFIEQGATMYTITVEVNDSTMGTAIGGGSYASGDIATLSATAYPGYHFVEWVQVSGSSTNPVSEDATFTISVTGNKTFRANFEADGTPVEYVEATIDTSDIVYWVGSGANRAMIAVNWVGAAYAWGVNFSTPSITVQAAMDSIVANDTRFNYTAAGGYLSNITFQEGCINLSGDTTSWWESKRNGVGGDMGLGQSLVNGDLEKWAQPVAGVWTDSVWDADWEYWYQVYTYTDSIVPMWAPQVGIESVPEYDAVIYSANSTIFVKGAEGQNIYVYDLNGRTVATKVNATETMAIPMGETGVYLVRIGNAAAKRVIVMR